MSSKTIDMQFMRYINLFRKVCGVSTTNCFVYNNVIIFAVPKKAVSVAIGKHGANMKRLGEILRKKIKVIDMPDDEAGLPKFVEDVVEPTTFNKIEIREGGVVISAGRQSKAALIGRNRIREKELAAILRDSFKIQKVRIA